MDPTVLDVIQCSSTTTGTPMEKKSTTTRRKSSARKKKGSATPPVQCHGSVASVVDVSPENGTYCSADGTVHTGCPSGLASTQETAPTSMNNGDCDELSDLLSALCDISESCMDLPVIDSGSLDDGEVVDILTPKVETHSSGCTPKPSNVKKPPRLSRDSKKKWGSSIKRGCLAQFTVKSLLYLPHVSEICIIQEKHVNCDGLVVHGGMKIGDRSAFSAHLSPEIRLFVEECLRRKDTPNQIMRKHIDLLKQWQAEGKDLTRDLLLTTKDICNISGKLAQETYMLHKNDAQSVRMWVQRNPEKIFYYSESNKEKAKPVEGELTGENMPFTIGIQTPWQRTMMLKYGNGGGISVDATFGTNEKKVLHDLFIVMSDFIIFFKL